MTLRREALLASVLAASFSAAFETGGHYDSTRAAAREWGFSEYAIRMLQLQNWYVDFYTNDPTFGSRNEVDLLHFDNLTTTRHVRAYWGYFTDNTRRALERAANLNDPFRALSLLGMSLHAVQDFYAHSNWAELHPPVGRAYRSITWFEDIPAPNDNRCYTGAYPNPLAPPNPLLVHGNYGYGLNHDSYSRPRYDEAYVFSYAATVQWLAATKRWVELIRPGFWNAMRTYNDPATRPLLDLDHYYLYRISEWVRLPTLPGRPDYIDGRWKGEFSGAATTFAWVSAGFLTYRSPFSMEFTNLFRYRELIRDLDNVGNPNLPIPAIEPLPTVNTTRSVVYVRTKRVDDMNWFTMDPPISILDFDTLPDFWARVTVNGRPYVEACRQITRSGPVNWLTPAIVSPATSPTVSVRYELFDEDANIRPAPPGGNLALFEVDEVCDINPAAGKSRLDMIFNLGTHALTGDVNGTHDTWATAITLTGQDGDNCRVEFFITEYPIIR